MTRHELDPLSLLFGLLFVGVGATAVTGVLEPAALDPGLVLPAVLIVAGVALLLTLPGRRAGRGEPERDPG